MLINRVTTGCQILAERKGRVASKKTIANSISCVKAIRSIVFESYDRPAEGFGPIQIHKDMPKRRYRPKFAKKAWPERLKQEWAGYREWKLKPILDPSEDEYRRDVCRPITIDRGHALRVNSYIGYLVREKSMSDFGLVDLCDTRNFSDFVGWHCAQDYRGGYLLLGTTATVLGTISQYLVAKNFLPPVIDGKNLWDTFYDLKDAS